MYKFSLNNLSPKYRVRLIEIINYFLIKYKIENNNMVIYRINEEIIDFLSFNEIFPEEL